MGNCCCCCCNYSHEVTTGYVTSINSDYTCQIRLRDGKYRTFTYWPFMEAVDKHCPIHPRWPPLLTMDDEIRDFITKTLMGQVVTYTTVWKYNGTKWINQNRSVIDNDTHFKVLTIREFLIAKANNNPSAPPPITVATEVCEKA